MIRRFNKYLFFISLPCVLFGFARYFYFRSEIKNISHSIVINSKSDTEKILKLTRFCYELESVSVKILSYEEIYYKFSGYKKLLAFYYKTIPFNVIPAVVLIKHGIAYAGPCGTKTKLLIQLLRANGFDARSVNLLYKQFIPLHSLLEVKIGETWTPVDPTFNLYFLDEQRNFISTNKLISDTALFKKVLSERIEGLGIYYPEEYYYNNLRETELFQYLISISRTFRIISRGNERDVLNLHTKLSKIIPQNILHFKIGAPFYYEYPSLGLGFFFILIFLFSGSFYCKGCTTNFPFYRPSRFLKP